MRTLFALILASLWLDGCVTSVKEVCSERHEPYTDMWYKCVDVEGADRSRRAKRQKEINEGIDEMFGKHTKDDDD